MSADVMFEVEISAEAIRERGFIPESEAADHCPEPHCDEEHGDLSDDLDEVVEILRRWHDDYHKGGFSVCYEQPCLDLRREGPL